MKRILLTIALSAFCTSALADDVYAIKGLENNCVFGEGAEGIIVVGKGRFSITETFYERVSPLVPTKNGFKKATYEKNSEGEDYGPVEMQVRITPERVDIRGEDGQIFTGHKCR